MGSSSSTQPQSEPDVEHTPAAARRTWTHFQRFALAAPDEVTTDPFETHHLTFHHCDDLYIAPHRDGERFVCFLPRTTTGRPDFEYAEQESLTYLTHWKLVYELMFGITRRSNEEDLNVEREHPRIMGYLGDFPFGFYLELVLPGSQCWVEAPAIEVPVTSPTTQDSVILRLYYRWALQSLSALIFMHSRGIYMDNFAPESVYIRSDLSVAITGFGVAYVENPPVVSLSWGKSSKYGKRDSLDGKDDEDTDANDEEDIDGSMDGIEDDEEDDFPYVPYEPPLWRGTELVRPNRDAPVPGPKTDLFDWAKWVWRLMTNDGSTSRPPQPHEPLVSMELETRPAWCKTRDEDLRWYVARYESRRFQRLEDKRLGEVLYKTFTEEFNDAEGAMRALRAAINAQGVGIVGQDEVAPEEGSERSWEDVLEIVRSEENPRVNYVRFKD